MKNRELSKFNKIDDEIDSMGYRIIEKENIGILAINYQSDNSELLKKLPRKRTAKTSYIWGKGCNL